MSLHGLCSDCNQLAQLRYMPDVASDEQSRPAVCDRCRDRRRELDPLTVACRECQTLIHEAAAVSIDVSAPDEYYPDYQYFCPDHSPLVSEVA